MVNFRVAIPVLPLSPIADTLIHQNQCVPYGGKLVPTAIRIIHDDITQLDVDAVVNAANSTLLGGGGVDGAIHAAAGPGLLEECRRLGGCPTSEARITGAYRLKARKIIHTVGPIWRGGSHGEADLLALCYSRSLRLATEHHLSSIAFPSISTGAYAFPLEQAAPIAIREVSNFVASSDHFKEVLFCCFSRHDSEVYSRLLRAA
jgi:O-acetyl-ADP-ribose deacetylase